MRGQRPSTATRPSTAGSQRPKSGAAPRPAAEMARAGTDPDPYFLCSVGSGVVQQPGRPRWPRGRERPLSAKVQEPLKLDEQPLYCFSEEELLQHDVPTMRPGSARAPRPGSAAGGRSARPGSAAVRPPLSSSTAPRAPQRRDHATTWESEASEPTPHPPAATAGDSCCPPEIFKTAPQLFHTFPRELRRNGVEEDSSGKGAATDCLPHDSPAKGGASRGHDGAEPAADVDDEVWAMLRAATFRTPEPPGAPVAPDDEAVIASMSTVEDVVAFFATHRRSGEYTPVKFVYLHRVPRQPHEQFRPYDLVVVPRRARDPDDYYVMSESSVVNVRGGLPSEVISLPAFMRESALFNVLSKIRFFSRYLKLKMFQQWQKNVRLKLFSNVRRRVSRDLFLAKRTFAPALSELSKMAHELATFPLLRMPISREGIAKEKFVAMMLEQKGLAVESFRAVLEQIEGRLVAVVDRVTRHADVPDLATPEALEQYLAALETEAAKESGKRINRRTMPMVTLKENTSRRMRQLKAAMSDFTLLPNFIRLIDLVCTEALFFNALDALTALHDELTRRDEEKLLFFVIAVSFGKDGLAFIPDEEEMLRMHAEVSDEIVGAVSTVPRLVVARHFRDHFDAIPRVFQLSSTLRTDHRVRQVNLTAAAQLSSDFAESTEATRHYNKNRRWFTYVNKDWPELRARWDERIAAEQGMRGIREALEGALQPADFADVFRHVGEAFSSIMDMHPIKRGCLVITSSAVLDFLQGKLREVELEVRTRLLMLAKSRLERVAQTFTSRIKATVDRPTSLTKFAAFVTQLNTVLEEQASLLRLAEEVEALYEIGEANGCEVQDAARRELVLGGPHAQAPGASARDRYEEAIHMAQEFRAHSVKEMTKKLLHEVEAERDVIYSSVAMLDSPQLHGYTTEVDEILRFLDQINGSIKASEDKARTLTEWQRLLGLPALDWSHLDALRQAFKEKEELWSTIDRWNRIRAEYYTTPLIEIDITRYQKEVDELYVKAYSKLNPKHRSEASDSLLEQLREEKQQMPTLLHFGNPHLRKEHWMRILGNQQRAYDPTISLESLKQLRMFDSQYRELIAEQSSVASGEAHLMASLEDISNAWDSTDFAVKNLRDSKDQFILDDVSEIVQQLEEHQLTIQSCLASRYVGGIRAHVEDWDHKLAVLATVIEEWVTVQGAWMYLEFIFSSEDIKSQLPTETALFKQTDANFKVLVEKAATLKNCILVGTEIGVLETLQEAREALDEIQKRLEDYLETKRAAFPRFYFLSNDELLSILSDVRNPKAVRPHLRKCFDSIKDLVFLNAPGTEIGGMISAEGEAVPFSHVVRAVGNIETWLGQLEIAMVSNLQEHMLSTLAASGEMSRTKWILNVQQTDEKHSGFPAQCIQAIDMVQWTNEVELAIARSASDDAVPAFSNSGDAPGHATATPLHEYYNAYLAQIQDMIKIVRMTLTPLQRSLIGTLLVIDVHNRDVVQALVEKKVTSVKDFEWSMQLRYYADTRGLLTVQHVNAVLDYAYEYLGSAKRLVITPLTDRAFLTCTQALHLNLGGAPQGPAGTGKTESVKDLGKALARQVVVFNCSDGINAATMSQMFAGLAQAGAWACFDEFNRIELEVLSVIAQQMLEITTSIAQGDVRMNFDGHDIRLHKNFGVFITMNPGYAGRTELPDNLKALFRPVCMMVPDYRLIAEIMFFSEGFSNASSLSTKMVQLYSLSSQQLSKQDHYDFGMRAVKSILVMAGSLKRSEPDEDENTLLIRAMRDSNIPKFLREDAALFNAIIQDLYPGLVITHKRNAVLEAAAVQCLEQRRLQPVPAFVEKVLQLHETMIVRHGVMLVGQSLVGKSTCLLALQEAFEHLSKSDDATSTSPSRFVPVHQHVVNPKAVSRDELYGAVNATTREWADGILSNLVRKVVSEANQTSDRSWIVFDGPVDAVWIENMNTVLDDNKMLCLVNGERLKIPDTVTFVFEVQDLRVASPATVSRCGMVFLEAHNLAGGWRPQAATRSAMAAQKYTADSDTASASGGGSLWRPGRVQRVLDELVAPSLDFLHANAEEWIPALDCQRVSAMLSLLEALIDSRLADTDEPQQPKLPKPEINEDGQELPVDAMVMEVERVDRIQFPDDAPLLEEVVTSDLMFDINLVFAFIWGVGGNLCEKNATREKFSDFVRPLIQKFVPSFPDSHTVFDFTVHKRAQRFVPWAYRVPAFVYRRHVPFFELLVPTAESTATAFVVRTMLDARHHVLVNGTTGTGKSVVVQSVLFEDLLTEDVASAWQSLNMVMSAQTSSKNLQEKLEGKLRKHPSKRKDRQCLGPATGKTMAVFVDDVNMPLVEEYGASPPLELLRQILVQGGMYDRKKCFFKDVIDVVSVACCGPPGGGKNDMTQRLTSRYFLLCQPTLPSSSVQKIFATILGGFFSVFSEDVQRLADAVAQATQDAYNRITLDLLPTPDKAHYTYNMRDIAKVVQGVAQVLPHHCGSSDELAQLWIHEASRVFHDRLICDEDREWWRKAASYIACLRFRVQPQPTWFTTFFGDFGADADEPVYQPLTITEELHELLSEKMLAFGVQFNRELDLVLFDDAVFHLARICRVLRQPRGNALLVGVGGSGRQSLAMLAAFITNCRRFQITITKHYGIAEFRDDLRNILLETGCEAKAGAFILSDTQIVKEQFLEDINNVLNTGEVANLWQPEDHDRIMGAMRERVIAAGKPETPNVMMSSFATSCRDHLHIVLAMSPVGAQFRHRLRMFPSLVNCMTIDWFSKWPRDALLSVAAKTLHNLQLEDERQVRAICELCVHIHSTVDEQAELYFQELRRRAYTTPTSYLSLLQLFASMLEERSAHTSRSIDRFASGVGKLVETNAMVDGLKETLIEMQPELEKQTVETVRFADEVHVEQRAAAQVAVVVAQEEKECNLIMSEAKAIKDDCQRELDKAMPAYFAAVEALNALNPKDINEAKAYTAPPKKVEMVMDAVLTILDEEKGWDNARRMMGKADFIQTLRNFDKDRLSEKTLRKLKRYVEMDDFRPEAVQSVSKACVSLCLWCRAIDNYCEVLKTVQPKQAKLKVAEERLAVAQRQLDTKQQELRHVQEKIARLQAQHRTSMEKKQALEEEKSRTELYLSRAGRLLSGLSSEHERWRESIAEWQGKEPYVVGFSVLAAAMVAYCGAFTAPFRTRLLRNWMAKCNELGVAVEPGFQLQDCVDPVMIRHWGVKGLPNDDFSTQNGTIVAKSTRWCLCIDPQGQANAWIKDMYRERGLKVVKMSDPNLLRTIETAVRLGTPVLLENVGESLDASLDTVLQRMTFKVGGRLMMTVRDQPVEYDSRFFFIITTRNPNPHYLPEVQIKTTLVNFTVTRQGLEDQLLADVVRSEKCELEERADRLIVQVADAKAQLVEIEDRILMLLSASQGNLLDNEVLINTLEQSKETARDIMENLRIAEETSRDISAAREEYRPVAVRASLVFGTISDIAALEHMYQNSLHFFKKLFAQTLARTERPGAVRERCEVLISAITTSGYDATCRGMFETHKPMFAFLLAMSIAQHEGRVTPAEWAFFLRGSGGAFVPIETPAPEGADWITDEMWDELAFLEGIAGLEGLTASFAEETPQWRLLYDAPASGVEGPQRFTAMPLWHQILTTRCFREERVAAMCRQFVVAELGAHFGESPAFDLAGAFADSAATTPLIIVLSPGTDPTTMFAHFAESKGFGAKKQMLSLGQNQGGKAAELIAKARHGGQWVYLQNCHVYASWMPQLDVIVEGLSDGDDIHPDFRLWLTTMPVATFPVTVLQNSVKVTREPPRGFKANLRDTFTAKVDLNTWDLPSAGSSANTDGASHIATETTWRRLLTSLTMLHAVIQERRRFGALGWNVPYEWNSGDFDASLLALRNYVTDFAELPWPAIHYVLGTINYGGRVTDSWDLRCLTVMLRDFLSAEAVGVPDRPLTADGVFRIPEAQELDAVVEYINHLPADDPPELFGLHPTAELRCVAKESRAFMNSIVDVQPRDVRQASAGEDPAVPVIQDFLARVPEAINKSASSPETYRVTELGTMTSLGTVASQEVDRYNTLIGVLVSTMQRLLAAIHGKVAMDAELEAMHASIRFFQVPKAWERAAYPSLRPLASWFGDLISRVEFFRDWNDAGVPTSFWLGGFFFPQGFLTGVLQTHSRQFATPIDALTLLSHPTNATDPDDPALELLSTGVYVHGLSLEGASWDEQRRCLQEPRPRTLLAPMPVLHLEPATAADARTFTTATAMYECPVYKVSTRAGALSTTGISTNFILAAHLPSGDASANHWVKRGTALISTLDV